jgi:tripartite-type tricarboxylate transporter receptor subunit TctC
MKPPRRTFLQLTGAALLGGPIFSRIARAQPYPTRPITMIVPFPSGGSFEAIGRVIAERMKGSLGQPIIIQNLSGAGGSIGVGRAARASPDGYTIDLGNLSTHVLNDALYSLQYDVLNDFSPISPLFTTPVVLLGRKTLPPNDLGELIAWLKANPSKETAGIQIASIHLMAAFFQKETGTQFTLVPYRGSAPAMQDLVAGHIDLLFDALSQLPLVRAGAIKAYAVTSDARLAMAPDIPSFSEMGLPALSFSGWVGLFAPRGTPKDVIAKINAAAVEALANPAVRSRIADFGYEVFPRERQTPEALGTLVKSDAEKWWPIIKDSGIEAK